MNVNKTADRNDPSEWTPALGENDLSDGEHRKVDIAGVSVLLHRSGGRVQALDTV